MFDFLRSISPRWWGVGALVLLGVLWFFFFRSGSANQQTLLVEPKEFLQQVSISGKVVSARTVVLAFSDTGRVASIPVVVGDEVSLGQVVATLANEVLYADLAAAKSDLQKIHAVQDAAVNSAYRKLISSGLVATPNSSSYSATAPTISGLYSGSEGTYKINFIHNPSEVSADKHQILTFGLERTDPIEVLKTEPAPLGTQGLYISFSDPLSDYDGTIWYVTIPNTSSSSYTANKNAYDEALRERDQAIAAAEDSVERIQAQLAQGALRAPFAGVVTAVPGKVGGISSANEPVVSLQSASALQIEVYIPEVNISLVKMGDEASTTLDAYGPDVSFAAHVVSIDPAETIRDGVSTYRTVLEFDTEDPRIKSGMTASVVITTARKENALVVPQGALLMRGNKTFVQVKIGKKVEEREVSVGLSSSYGFVEITSGLSAGEEVVLSQ